MISTLQANLMLSGELMSELNVFGSRGHEKQSYYAVTFIGEINRADCISRSSMKTYLDDVVHMNASSEWPDEKTEERAGSFIELLQRHVHELSIDSAQALVDFSRLK